MTDEPTEWTHFATVRRSPVNGRTWATSDVDHDGLPIAGGLKAVKAWLESALDIGFMWDEFRWRHVPSSAEARWEPLDHDHWVLEVR